MEGEGEGKRGIPSSSYPRGPQWTPVQICCTEKSSLMFFLRFFLFSLLSFKARLSGAMRGWRSQGAMGWTVPHSGLREGWPQCPGQLPLLCMCLPHLGAPSPGTAGQRRSSQRAMPGTVCV